jgi:hypothetical protein
MDVVGVKRSRESLLMTPRKRPRDDQTFFKSLISSGCKREDAKKFWENLGQIHKERFETTVTLFYNEENFMEECKKTISEISILLQEDKFSNFQSKESNC